MYRTKVLGTAVFNLSVFKDLQDLVHATVGICNNN